MRRQVLVFILVFTITFVAAYGLFSLRPYSVVEGVTGFRLVGECSLYNFTQTTQPMQIWVLACPRKDMIRLWPLPIQQPWYEDWWENQNFGIDL
jgi:hypothetical protein